MISIAFMAEPSSTEAMWMRPSSSTSILQPVLSMIERIIFPPGPITSRILSLLMRIVKMRGANVEMFARGLARVVSMTSRMRSEEHTSELQSRVDLVCRLLLEKKKHEQNAQQRHKDARQKRTVDRGEDGGRHRMHAHPGDTGANTDPRQEHNEAGSTKRQTATR